MKKLLMVLLAIFLFVVPCVYAENYTYSEVGFTFKDIETDVIVGGLPIKAVFLREDIDLKIESKKFLDVDGFLSYKLSPGKWKIGVVIDNPKTAFPDYQGSLDFQFDQDFVELSQIVYVERVGLVDGVVTDHKGNLIKEASVNIKCGDEFELEALSDGFGAFDFGLVPTGTCKLSAQKNNLVGFQKVDVLVGGLSEVNMALENSFFGSTPIYYLLLIIVIFVLVAYLAVRISRKRFKKKNDSLVNTVTEIEVPHETVLTELSVGDTGLNLRAKDLMKTFNAKEKKVVDYLLDGDYSAGQARIRDATGIPKTSLSRVFDGLESKKIVEIEKVGKLKKVKLTDWFLGRD
jgi:hypothetical protein